MYCLKQVINPKENRKVVHKYSIIKNNDIYEVYNYKKPSFNMTKCKEFKDEDELKVYLKKEYPIKTKSLKIWNIVKNKGIIYIEQNPKLFITYKEEKYILSSRAIHNSISKKLLGLGLWWEYGKRPPLDTIEISWKK